MNTRAIGRRHWSANLFAVMMVVALVLPGAAQPAAPVRGAAAQPAEIALQAVEAPRRLAPCPTELFFSEYIEGLSNNKAIEIYNGTGAPVDLSQYRVELYSNGSTTPSVSNSTNLTGTLAAGDVFVIVNAGAIAGIRAQADMTHTVTYFNGDDAVALLKNGTIIDVIGRIGEDPGSEWGTGLLSTADNTIRRKASVTQGNISTISTTETFTNLLTLEWEGYATDDYANLGSHTVTCGAPAPVVSSTSPISEAVDVATGTLVQAVFDRALDPASVTATSFLLEGPSGAVAGEVGYLESTHTAVFTPSAALATGTRYTATLTTGITAGGTAMAAPYSWSFTTLSPDVTPPQVTGVSPAAEAANVSLNTAVTATFDEAVTGVDGTSFTLEGPAGAVAGTVGYDAGTRTATFTPGSALAGDTRYTATLSTAIEDTAGNPLAATSWSFTTEYSDVTPPQVTAVFPAAEATGVSMTTALTATFDEAVTGVDDTSFTLAGPAGAVAGSVSYDAGTRTATFTPAGDLAGNSRYTATLSAAIEDTAGNPLGATSWSFTTEIPDLTPPQVTAVSPAAGATGIPMTATLTAMFDEDVDGVDSGSFTLEGPAGAVAGGVSYNVANRTATLDPTGDLAGNTRYTATLSSAIHDIAGNPLEVTSWSFTTEVPDLTPPQVTAVFPAAGATGVDATASLTATFDEAVSGVSGASFTLVGPTGAVTAVVSYNAGTRTAMLNPSSTLAGETRYTATLSSAIADPAGNPLTTYSWSFTTGVVLGYTPIATARAAGAGWSGSVRGYVSVVPGTYRGNALVIQDETGGLYLYTGNLSLPQIALGDMVRVTGTLKLYNGLLEMDPISAIRNLSPSEVPPQLVAARPISVSGANAAQGQLVQIRGSVSWTKVFTAPGASDWSMTLTDASGSVQVFVDKDTAIDMRGYVSPTQMIVTGFSGNYNGAQVMPRYQNDIVEIDTRAPQVTGTVPANDATGINPYRPLEASFNELIDPASVGAASFTLTGPTGAVAGSVGYFEAERKAVFTPTAALEPQTRYTATLGTGILDLSGNPLAASYSWSFTTGALDTQAPTITDRFPAADATEVGLGASVVVTFSEPLDPGTVPGNILLTGPYGTVAAKLTYDAGASRATLAPVAPLLPLTRYTATVRGSVADWAGLTLGADSSWSFQTSAEPPMAVYHGDIHNHTSYSDGSGTPQQALAAGRASGMDFMAISDHSYAIDDTEWANTLDAVESATDGSFVGLRGFEYTQGAEGHINVYNTTRHAVRTNTGCSTCDYTPNLEQGVTVQGFYQWLSITGTMALDGAGTVMQFNHPGWINFNDWTYHPEVSNTARLEEVGNGHGTSYVFSEDEYIRSLDYGWKVGASNNSDTHSYEWGTNTDHRTGVWMPSLTKADLLAALQARRTFASEDKNYALRMKANGVWMGSELPNTGEIVFDIYGSDPDGEVTTLVQLITDRGRIVTETAPAGATFTWEPQVAVTEGVHYFYVKAIQADGERIVGSPVWTMGAEDISITDVVIQPTIPTIHSPSLLTARVTNRADTTRTVTVTMDVNGTPLPGSVVVNVPPYNDAYANFSWQPLTTGPATITAQFTGALADDNPDDNRGELLVSVSDEHLPLILIDAGHGNTNAAGREMRMFIADLSDHRYNVLKNLDALTAADLNTETVKLLLITAPELPYSDAELNAIADYVAGGGSLWLCGLADYTGKVAWANTVADRLNAILDRIELRTGSPINMRMNDDEVIDADDNNGYVFGVYWKDFPGADSTSIGVNVNTLASWSLNSLRGRTVNDPLTAATPGVTIVVQGDLDEGFGPSPWRNPNHTTNEDADSQNDAYIYNPTWVYPNPMPSNAVPVPMGAVTQLPNGAGRIMLYGDSNDPFTTFAYTAGDGKQNELFNLQSVMWLLGQPLQKSTIAEARADAEANDTPDQLDQLVWVEGKITAAFGEFFNVLYVEDETGGITVHAPAGDIDAAQYARGAYVRVVGTVGLYEGDTEVEFFEAEQVQVITPTDGIEPTPMPLTTHLATQEAYEGRLAVVTGTVMSKSGSANLVVNDGSGSVRAFLDGYNGTWDDVTVGSLVVVRGLVSEDGAGPRIRVRNHGMHAGIPDDLTILAAMRSVFLPLVFRNGH